MSTQSQGLNLRLPVEPNSVTMARRAVLEFASDFGIDAEGLAVAVSEAVTNVILHAYRGRENPGTVEIGVECRDEHLTLVVSDAGVGLIPDPASKGAGFGLGLIGAVSDCLEMRTGRERGTRLTMRFRRQLSV